MKEIRIVLAEESQQYKGTKVLDAPENVIDFVQRNYGISTVENVIAVYLTSQLEPVCYQEISKGTLNRTCISPMSVIQGAVLSNCKNVILFHNHPSGTLDPSDEDIQATEQIAAACRICGLVLLDHIIVAPNKRFLSMCRSGFTTVSNTYMDTLMDMILSSKCVEDVFKPAPCDHGLIVKKINDEKVL